MKLLLTLITALTICSAASTEPLDLGEGNFTEEGVSDLSVSFKHRTHEQKCFTPSLAIVGELSLPTGSRLCLDPF